MIGKKIYLGDSVYAKYDGVNIVLTTENGLPGDPSNTIAIEGHVFSALERFRDQILCWLYERQKPVEKREEFMNILEKTGKL